MVIEQNNEQRDKMIMNQMGKISLSQKLKVILVLLTCILFLNSQLIVSYYQSQLVFDSDVEATLLKRYFFVREECAYNVLLFMKEKLIRNATVWLKIYTTDTNYTVQPSVKYYLNVCLDYEA